MDSFYCVHFQSITVHRKIWDESGCLAEIRSQHEDSKGTLMYSNRIANFSGTSPIFKGHSSY